MTIDERIQAIAESVELLTADVHKLQASVSELRDAAFPLLTVSGQHYRRIQGLEGSPQ
ncbi:MAG: hypothetical protein ACR2NN_23885 [Bryobacteraceae bacterium]